MNNITIAVDAMGGDFGTPVVVPASLQMLNSHKNLQIILVGDQDILQKELRNHQGVDFTRLTLQHASQHIAMDESPALALRNKKDSSMRVAINLVKEGKADACVSAGNTGALMATARFVLKTLPGIDRPAIVSSFPTYVMNKSFRMLDLGANVDSTPENLFQFAVMASVLASAVDHIPNPKIFLLNIGSEDIKGNELVKQTAQLLSNTHVINYEGFIEADEMCHGHADIVVCDGFVGNVALKTMEGVAVFIVTLIKQQFNRSFLTKLVGLLARPILKKVGRRIDPNRYNGATFLGLRGIVIKSHGNANKQAFARAIEEAILQAENNVSQKISAEVERLLQSSQQNNSSTQDDLSQQS